MLQPTNGVILGMKQTYGTVDLSLVDMKAYNMLNTKYLIVDGKVLTNPVRSATPGLSTTLNMPREQMPRWTRCRNLIPQ